MLLLFETAAGYALFTVKKGEKQIKKTDVRAPPARPHELSRHRGGRGKEQEGRTRRS